MSDESLNENEQGAEGSEDEALEDEFFAGGEDGGEDEGAEDELEGDAEGDLGEAPEGAAGQPMGAGEPTAEVRAVDAVVRGVKELSETLDQPDMEPVLPDEPGAPSYRGRTFQDRLGGLRATLEEDVFRNLDAACKALGNATSTQNLRNNVAYLAGELAVLYYLSGQSSVALRMLRDGEKHARDEVQAELAAAQRDLDAYVSLVRARYYHRRGDFDQGDRILKKGLRGAKDQEVKGLLDKGLGGPRPLTGGAPPLFRINGFGVGIYGHRDENPKDGSYVTTYCISALFIPIFPLTAYRVIDQGGNSYLFIAKERLSAFARGYRWLVLFGILAAILWGMASSYLNSPERRQRIALDEAHEVEESGDTEEALRRYQQLLDEWGGYSEVGRESAAAILRLSAAQVQEPMTLDRMSEALAFFGRYEAFPEGARGHEAARVVVDRATTWASQITGSSEREASARVRLLAAASRALGAGEVSSIGVVDHRSQETLMTALREARVGLADQLAEEWPLEALRHYADAQEGGERATETARSLLEEPSLLLEAEADLRRFHGADGQIDAAIATALAGAISMRDDLSRQAALASGDEEALRAALVVQPRDQEVIAALSLAQRARGEHAAAAERLRAIGSPGRMIPAALSALSAAIADGGDLEEADALLHRYVEARLPLFADAQRAYDAAFESRRTRISATLRLGIPPYELRAQLDRVPYDEARQREIIREWISQQITGDEELNRLREELTRYSGVVQVALTQGTLKLRRAREASGEERERLLGEAERLFLAIRDQAEGVPTFHLSLGQVYYRLGREEEGEAEMQRALDQGEPELSLAAAHAYRELGKTSRARAVAEQVWNQTEGAEEQSELRGAAAVLIALTSTTLEEEQSWLERAPRDLPSVRTNLTRVRADLALREGRFPEADRLYAQVASDYEAERSDPAAVNNAALARSARFLCTGDLRRLEEAVEGLSRATQLMPDNSLLLSNYAAILEYQALLRVLGRYVDVAALRPSQEDALSLLEALLSGSEREAVLQAVSEDAGFGRAAELGAQVQVLAPQSANAYGRTLRWGVLRRDAEALGRLRQSLAQVTLDTEAQTQAREAYVSASEDDPMRSGILGALPVARAGLRTAARARADVRAHTEAAAKLLLGRALLTASVYDEDSRARTEEAVGALRESHAAWPELGTADLARALVSLAVQRAAERAPDLRELLGRDGRRYGVVLFAQRAAASQGSISDAIRAQPELAEAVALRRGAPIYGLGDLALAALSGDEALTRGASTLRQEPAIVHELALREIFLPGAEDNAGWLDLVGRD